MATISKTAKRKEKSFKFDPRKWERELIGVNDSGSRDVRTKVGMAAEKWVLVPDLVINFILRPALRFSFFPAHELSDLFRKYERARCGSVWPWRVRQVHRSAVF
jgi:hypothetical protein